MDLDGELVCFRHFGKVRAEENLQERVSERSRTMKARPSRTMARIKGT